MSSALILALIAVLLVVQGTFSGSELALVSADRLRLQSDAGRGSRGASIALAMLSQPTRMLGTCLVGTNLCAIAIATMGTQLVLRHSEVPAPLAFLFVVPFTLTLGELVPKTVFQYHADSLVPILVFPLRLCGLALSPVLWVFDAIIHVAGGVEMGDRPLTREGIRVLLNVSQDPNLSPEDKAMIRRVFAFTEAVVEDAMVPLIHVVAVPESSTCAEAAEHMIRSGHSRIPVYKERIDDITGVLLYQDLMSTQDWGTAVSEICRVPLFVPETKRVDHLLQEMRRLRKRMAVVVDEYGGAVGLITVEDLIEEIVGEIEDESDRSRTRVRRLDDRNWLALGRSEREHLEATCGLQLPDGDFETLAGYVLTTVGRIPKTGECVQLGEYSLTVSNVSDRAILEVHIRRNRE